MKKMKTIQSDVSVCLFDVFHLSPELLGKWHGGFKSRSWRVSRAMHGRAVSSFVLDASESFLTPVVRIDSLSLLARLFKLDRFIDPS